MLRRAWGAFRAGWERSHDFFHHPLHICWSCLKRAALKVGAAFLWLGRHLVRWVRMVPRRVWLWAGGSVAALAVLVVGVFCGVCWYIEQQATPDTNDYQIRYLNQGWGMAPDSHDRRTYYFTPQGAYLKFVRYNWLVHLERPWKTTPFADPQYMRGYGFVVEPAEMGANPGHLPVGLAPHWDPWFDNMMVDLTCAACHTGELHTVKDGAHIAVRIDGGPAMHDITSTRLGRFGTDLTASLIATYYNPLKWRRFCANVLRDQNNSTERTVLRNEVWNVLWPMLKQGLSDSRMGLYPYDEGNGRTDALQRIANNVFGSITPRNKYVADAPVSYPPVWDIWKFDWVQYGGSVSQPMARNIGESLGSGALYHLQDYYGRPVPQMERYTSSTMVPNLRHIENALHNLRAPCWPEDLFGKIDWPLAREGADLFHERCQSCHGPHPAPDYQRAFDSPEKAAENLPDWVMHLVAIDDVGTDPLAALNFVTRRYDLTGTFLHAQEVREEIRETYTRQFTRRLKYDAAVMQKCVKGSQDYTAAAAELEQLNPQRGTPEETQAARQEAMAEYIRERTGQMNLASVGSGEGLTYLIAFIRDQAYKDLGLDEKEREMYDGYGMLDTPQALPVYKPRPLGGVWATAPYLHNGSVPNLYELLSPVYLRSKKFYLGSRDFDPYRVGLYSEAAPGAFLFDTAVRGNSNTGHEFRAGYRPWKPGNPPAYGVIGPELTDHQRWAIIEYLKVHRDDPNDTSCGYTPIAEPAEPPDAACAVSLEKKP